VNRAQSRNDFITPETDDFSFRKQLLKNAKGFSVVGIVEDRRQQEFIGDVKIRVARGQTRAVKEHGTRTRQGHDRKFVAVLIGCTLQTFAILLKKTIVVIVGIIFDDAHDRPRVDEARDVIDMAVGVIPHDAFA
jgi:hypothetical protein